MADKQLRFVLTGTDQSASKTITGVADHGESATKRIGSAFSKLGGMVGDEFGELASRVGEGLDQIGEHGMTAGQKISAIGTLAAGAGAFLTAMGSKEKQATDQLDTAIRNTGHDAEEFTGQIEETVHHMEKYGDSAVSTKNALATLTNATHDPEQALRRMQVAADLAASSHVSLDEAATQVARALGGSGRIFKQYGIEVKTNSDGTKDYAGAVDQLSQVLHGQANASVDNFTGKLKGLRAEVTDNVAAFGEKWGPAITSAGVTLAVLGPTLAKAGGWVKGMGKSFLTAGTEAEAGAAEVAAADEEIVASNEAAAASARGVGGSMVGMAGTIGVAGVAIAGLVVAGNALSKSLDGNESAGNVMFNWASGVAGLNEALVNNAGDMDAAGKQWLQAQIQSTGLGQKAAQAGITIDQLTAAVQGGKEPFEALIQRWERSGHASKDGIAALYALAGQYQQGSTESQHLAETTDEATGSTKRLTAAQLANESAHKHAALAAQQNADSQRLNMLTMQDENNAVGLLTASLNHLNNQNLGAEQSELSFKDSLESVTNSVKQNGRSVDDNTTKGRANKELILQSIQAAQQHAEAVASATQSTKQATAAYHSDIDALKAHLTQLGLQPAAIQAIIDKYGKMPKVVPTKVELRDAASAPLRNMMETLDALTNRDWTINVTQSGDTQVHSKHSSAGGHYATGSPFFPGGQAVVAEREQEIIAPRGSTITPVSRLKFGRGGGDLNISVHVSTPVADAAFGRFLVGELEKVVRSGMRIQGVTS